MTTNSTVIDKFTREHCLAWCEQYRAGYRVSPVILRNKLVGYLQRLSQDQADYLMDLGWSAVYRAYEMDTAI
jgi:hypothetical protein